MEDENELELSLGLSCGGSSGKSKNKDGPLDPKAEEESSSRGGNMSVSDVSFMNFFQTDVENKNHDGKQKSDPVLRPQDNFWTELGKCPASGDDGSNQFGRSQDLWVSNSKTTDKEEDKSGSRKRKSPFEDANLQKKHERAADYADSVSMSKSPIVVSVRNSRVSVTTEDGSTGENEDVAESEAEGSNSYSVAQLDEKKCSDVPRYSDKCVLNDHGLIGSQRQKALSASGTESNSELGKVQYGMPPQLQPLTVMSVPYPVPVKVPTTSSLANTTGFSSPCAMQLMPLANDERPMVQTMSTSNLQLTFGYSPVQLPTLETNSTWAFGSQPQLMSFTGRIDGASNPGQTEDGVKISHGAVVARGAKSPATALTHPANSLDVAKCSAKHAADASTYHSEPEGQGNSTNSRPKEILNQHVMESFPVEGSAIRPGIAPNIKFGGCGSYPDLPWVSTTGSGPNGKTISGVTYKYNKNQIKIVCACHGSHMTPDEFVQHANSDLPVPENKTGLPTFSGSNPTTSAQG